MRFLIESTQEGSCLGLEERYKCLFDYNFTRIENARYPDRRCWDTCYVEINTLEELMGFIDRTYGVVVITTDDNTLHETSIEIYDGYRE